MLSKLLNYEIKATGRIFLPFFLSILIFAGITKFISAIDPQKWNTPATISMVIYIVLMAGMFVMTLTMMIQRFSKNLLSDEGYLMHTLPVKPWKHIVSKLLVSMLWMIGSVAVALISILVITYKKGMFGEIVKGLATVHDRVIDQLGPSAYLLTLEVILGVLISLASGILLVYASIAIGHLFNRHKMLATFGAFIALNTLTQIFFKLVSLIPGIAHFYNFSIHNMAASDSVRYQLVICYGIFFAGLLCAAYLAVTNFILSKRLNLE
ncbi:hypothetical protein [Desulfosporosinus sp. BG]|uniref:hypothetical protein n=1 Tax=Desulfosporosinus sp. BG TaxID=1633135 RepID=UPI000839E2D3|nr:hypothetical protein [Desulfosporosinus sp. BG]ODA41037.1 ABC transporter, ATP-binding protein [Desulfosporosinus sp. BG]